MTKKSDFLDDIKLVNKPNKTLEDLQYLIRNKQIKEEDLSEKEIIALKELYQTQISELKQSIKACKGRILKLKNKSKC